MIQGIAVIVLALLGGHAGAQEFPADAITAGIDTTGGPRASPGAQNTALPTFARRKNLKRPKAKSIGTLPRICPCGNTGAIVTSDIRDLSDTYAAGGDSGGASFTNYMWAWGQFVDHDIVGTIDNTKGPSFQVKIKGGRNMILHRVRAKGKKCPKPLNVQTGRLDGGPIYGTDKFHELRTLRSDLGCYLRESEPGWLPITTKADSSGKFFFLAGDLRVDEHSVLTSMHNLWMREHNRLCRALASDPKYSKKTGFSQYNIAKATVISKMQQITVKEWLPKFGITKSDLQKAKGKIASSDVSVEFSVLYRLGHSLIPNSIGSKQVADLFDGQKFYLDEADGGVTIKPNANATFDSIWKDLTSSAAPVDAKVSSALRDVLFGKELGEDLVGRNIFRGRDLALPSYADMAKCLGLTHDETIQAETPDAWLAALRESEKSSGVLGPLLRAIMVEQFHRMFFGIRGYWWEKSLKNKLGPFLGEVQSATLGQVINDNSGASVGNSVF